MMALGDTATPEPDALLAAHSSTASWSGVQQRCALQLQPHSGVPVTVGVADLDVTGFTVPALDGVAAALRTGVVDAVGASPVGTGPAPLSLPLPLPEPNASGTAVVGRDRDRDMEGVMDGRGVGDGAMSTESMRSKRRSDGAAPLAH
jgi:hypothetical protein